MSEQLLPRGEVERRTGLSRSSLYREMRRGSFPEPFRVGPKAVRWRLSEVEQWIDGLQRSHADGIHRASKAASA